MKKRTRTEYSIINMSTDILGYAVNTLVGFVCRVIFVRMLGAEYLGIRGLFTNVLSVLSLAELGIGSAIIYALYKPIAENNKEKIAAIIQYYKKAYAAIGAVVAVVGLAVLPFLNQIIHDQPNIKENLYLIYLLYLFNTVASYYFSYRASLFTASQRQYIVQGYNYVVTILQSVFQILFLVLTHEYLTYLIIQVLGGLSYNIWISRKAVKDYPFIKDKDVPPLSPGERKSLFINIRALALNKVSGVLVNSTDNIAITYFSGLSSVGLASNYTILSGMVGKMIGLVFNAIPGSVGNLNATASDEERYNFFNVLNLLNFWLFGWGAIGIALVSTDLVKALYGAEYELPFRIPLIIAINSFTIGMLQAVYTYKSTLGLFRYGQFLLFFTGFINLVLDVVLGRRWGVFGIFLATLIARMITNLWYEPYAVYRYGLKKSPWIYWKRYASYLIVLVIAGGVSFMLCHLLEFPVIINAILKFIICCIVPNSVFILFFHKRPEFVYLKGTANYIKGKILRKVDT